MTATLTFTPNHTYCNEPVELLHVESNDMGLVALIAYEDGREEEVPYRALKPMR